MMRNLVLLILAVVLAITAVTVGLPLFAIGCENLLVKWEIQNPYVDEGFSDWNAILLSDCGVMMIPSEWTCREQEDIFYLYDETGDLWAAGAAIGGAGDRFGSMKQLLESLEDTRILEIETEAIVPFSMMDGSSAVRIVVRGSGVEITRDCMRLFISTEREFLWILINDIAGDDGQYDLTEAMVYSYAFGRRDIK